MSLTLSRRRQSRLKPFYLKSLTVNLYIGHHAAWKETPTAKGLTHDWQVYLMGKEEQESKLGLFIEKVVFTLHPSFKKPKRVVESPPFEVSESGYGDFTMKVGIFFKIEEGEETKEEERKVDFEYPLSLPKMTGPPIIQNEIYKSITFENPSEQFTQKLLEAGVKLNITRTMRIVKVNKEGEEEIGRERLEPAPPSPRKWDDAARVKLHQKMSKMRNMKALQEVVNTISATGKYEYIGQHFQFDITKLDASTLDKLSQLVN